MLLLKFKNMNKLTQEEAIEMILSTVELGIYSYVDDTSQLLDEIQKEYQEEMEKMGIDLDTDFEEHPFYILNEAMGRLLHFVNSFDLAKK
jgi:hypothetical protein